MNSITIYLLGFRNDIFKLLPMREIYDSGENNYINDYLETLIINSNGAMKTFPQLQQEKKYITVTNTLNYLTEYGQIPFSKWRKLILNSTRNIDDLRTIYECKGGD